MNELIIVRTSEIILAILAFFGIVIVLLATWHDFRVIAEHRRQKITHPTSPFRAVDTVSATSIRALPAVFSKLSRTMIAKALSWRTSELRETTIYAKFRPARSLLTPLFTSIGLVLYISVLSYFFYTAATLRSDTLLTLSWIGVSLWLAATVWSNEKILLSKRSEITFAIPFMYFVFYVVSFVYLARQLTLLVRTSLRVSSIYVRQLGESIKIELYSTRF